MAKPDFEIPELKMDTEVPEVKEGTMAHSSPFIAKPSQANRSCFTFINSFFRFGFGIAAALLVSVQNDIRGV